MIDEYRRAALWRNAGDRLGVRPVESKAGGRCLPGNRLKPILGFIVLR
ncbi:MAG: hypothetical protein ACREFY_11800 [Acetobacteraceae bacterium]